MHDAWVLLLRVDYREETLRTVRTCTGRVEQSLLGLRLYFGTGGRKSSFRGFGVISLLDSRSSHAFMRPAAAQARPRPLREVGDVRSFTMARRGEPSTQQGSEVHLNSSAVDNPLRASMAGIGSWGGEDPRIIAIT
jgi:hypothetical protein